MNKPEHRVAVSNGKYTFIVPTDDYRVSILRHGKPWHGPQAEASNALFSIMAELDAARVVVQAVRMHVAEIPVAVNAALALHGRLVDDREPPSAWCDARTPPATVAVNALRLTDDELTMAQQAIGEAGRAGQRIRAAALQKLLEFYKRAVTPDGAA